ncbi:hypothetical protein Mgra_00004270 [Meloidogyne graminicola]|uniref:Uncharacterized protein n=1 Tax=Meloidogyne graminicola TaxID=189291 RepID=A0A8S9ZSS2_9BILA|nr:hypothetical protein Mgra_00004270 [Meloidogyne graminicola]
MGPRDESGANQPRRANNLDSIEDDEDGQDNGWHIGLDVESQSVGIEVASSNTTDQNGYQQLSSSSNVNDCARWIPPTTRFDLPEAPPPENPKIEHQPVDISMDKDKVDQIKSIMYKMNGSLHENILKQPDWLKNVDDKRLGDYNSLRSFPHEC